MRVTGQLTDGSRGSRVTKRDPLSALKMSRISRLETVSRQFFHSLIIRCWHDTRRISCRAECFTLKFIYACMCRLPATRWNRLLTRRPFYIVVLKRYRVYFAVHTSSLAVSVTSSCILYVCASEWRSEWVNEEFYLLQIPRRDEIFQESSEPIDSEIRSNRARKYAQNREEINPEASKVNR